MRMTLLSTMSNTRETLEVSDQTLERKRRECNIKRKRNQMIELTKSSIEGTTNKVGTRLRYGWPKYSP